MLITSVILIGNTACENLDEPIKQEEKQTRETEHYNLSDKDAFNIAKEAVSRLKFGDYEINSRSQELKAKEIREYPYASRVTNRACHIVNFENGGYAVIAPNSEVLALDETGEFNPEENPGDSLFMLYASDFIAELRPEYRDSLLKPNNPSFMVYIWHNDHRCGHTNTELTTIKKFYLLKTNWHQRYPYNNNCPLVKNENNEMVKAPVGCVPLAIAQIMAYHKKPSSHNGYTYNWEEITKFSTVMSTQAIADAAHLCYKLGTAANTQYGANGSGTISKNMKNVLVQFGYSNAIYCDTYSEDILLNEVTNGRPVAFGATGTKTTIQSKAEDYFDMGEAAHMWIIDGAYQLSTVKNHINIDTNLPCYTTVEYNTFFHCNWGWGVMNESNGGYYSSKVFKPQINSTQYNYNNNFHFIYNIK